MLKAADASAVPAADRAVIESRVNKTGEKLGAYLDMDLWKKVGDREAVEVESTGDHKFTLSVTVPDHLLNAADPNATRTFYIVRVADGVAQVLAATTETQISFATDSFGTYAITYKDDVKSPQIGDNSHMGLWIMLMMLSSGGIAATLLYGRKKRALAK